MSAERSIGPSGKLKRVLGAGDATWLVAGNMVGAGIFITPGLVADKLPGLTWPLLAWALGGLLALCGAAVYAELGARLPRAGGDYQYLTVAFGPVWGFLTGWASLVVTFSAAAAVMTIVTVEYLRAAWPPLAQVPAALGWIVGPLLVVLLTLANVAGARVSGWTTALLTALPIAGLAGLCIAGFVAGTVEIRWPEGHGADPGSRMLALGQALIPVFYTYSGWNAAAYVAGEIRDPGRNLARGLLWGTALVTVLYMLINLVLLAVVPAEELAGSTTAASQAAHRLLGREAEQVLSWVIALAVLGSANVTLMAGARIYYAMAHDGLAPRVFARTNAAGVPAAALWIGGLWTALLSTMGRVEQLLNWCTLAILVLSAMAVAALFVLRRRSGEPATFRCPGYPLTPALYLIACIAVACASVIQDWRQSLWGVLIVASGFPVYALIRAIGDRSNFANSRN